MKKNMIIILALFCLGGLIFWAIKKNKTVSENANPNKLQVVASFYPLYFFASAIGGDKVEVTNIVPAGAEPHDYEPKAQDLMKMENSQLIILNGGGLEPWQDNIKQNIDAKKTVIIVVSEGLTTRQMREGEQDAIDPHVWLDPVLAEKIADKIVKSFLQADPTNEKYYEDNAIVLKNKLIQLDEQYRKDLNNCAKKDIITSHSAFGYLSAEYGLNQVSIAGLSPDAEPSPSQLADIAKFAAYNNVKYIFFESLASPKLASTLATEIGAQTLVLNPLEGLTPAEISQGKNYLTVMQDNLTNLQTALQCQ